MLEAADKSKCSLGLLITHIEKGASVDKVHLSAFLANPGGSMRPIAGSIDHLIYIYIYKHIIRWAIRRALVPMSYSTMGVVRGCLFFMLFIYTWEQNKQQI